MSDEMINAFGKSLHTYTDAETLKDGVLVDVSDAARKAGFNIPVALTRTVWDQHIAGTDKDTTNQSFQDEAGRLWNFLLMLSCAIKIRSSEANQVIYELYVDLRNGKSHPAECIKLKSFIGGGDKKEPVITIMLPT
jgi:type I site-specific restriction-modification system R (restriction) subunit